MDIDKQPTHKTQGAIEFDFFLPFVLFTCYIETYQNQNFSLYSYIVCIDYGFVCFVSLSLPLNYRWWSVKALVVIPYRMFI